MEVGIQERGGPGGRACCGLGCARLEGPRSVRQQTGWTPWTIPKLPRSAHGSGAARRLVTQQEVPPPSSLGLAGVCSREGSLGPRGHPSTAAVRRAAAHRAPGGGGGTLPPRLGSGTHESPRRALQAGGGGACMTRRPRGVAGSTVRLVT